MMDRVGIFVNCKTRACQKQSCGNLVQKIDIVNCIECSDRVDNVGGFVAITMKSMGGFL